MNARGLRRYVDDLLRGGRPTPFRPDDFEASQIRTAIDLQAARPGADEPREEFLARSASAPRRADGRRPAAGGIGELAGRQPPAGDGRAVVGRGGGGRDGDRRSPAIPRWPQCGRPARPAGGRRRRTGPDQGELAAGGGEFGCGRGRCDAPVRTGLAGGVCAPGGWSCGGGVGGVHASGLPAVFRALR